MKARAFILAGLGFLSLGVAALPWRTLDTPAHFPATRYEFSRNPLDARKVQLGRALFYDPVLSRDSSTSCASCHSPFNAFAHTDHPLSHGINDQIGTRNAPALFNLAWQQDLMWDGAVSHLDMLALAPISDPREMDEEIGHVVEKLNRIPRYSSAFAKAFGAAPITGEQMLKSLAQFELTLVSAEAKYDSVQRGEAAYTPQEAAGYRLYQANCSSCHAEPLFTRYQFSRNGLPLNPLLNDSGRAGITQRAADTQRFKVPSLRNLRYTFPYMHDGRFPKLRHVLDHYTEGIAPNAEVPPELRGGLRLNSDEKTDLIAFLHTLNDKNFVFNPQHWFPKDFFFPPEGNSP
ncbi:MAG: cytochrome c peroxidase [Bacteroidota bacterium]